MTNESRDPVLEPLADLARPAPAAAHSTRVRARCHAALAARTRTGRSWQRLVDRLLPLTAVLYAVVVVVQALRMAGII